MSVGVGLRECVTLCVEKVVLNMMNPRDMLSGFRRNGIPETVGKFGSGLWIDIVYFLIYATIIFH
jgi:hypothetical protein